MNKTAKEILVDSSARQGWNQSTVIEALMEFIDTYSLGKKLDNFIERKIRAENEQEG
jgi:hypothetical protein